MKRKAKVGEIVHIDDSSYSVIVIDGRLVSFPEGMKGYHWFTLKNDDYIVIETECKFPCHEQFQEIKNRFNNTIIQHVKTATIIFIEDKFLTPKVHEITIDGKRIELSQKSYQNLKEQLC